jgi:hypothetical protein
MEQRPIRQEVDLLKLLAKTYSLLKKNIILVIVCPGLGLLLGYLYTQFSTQPQLSNAVVQSTLMLGTDLLTEHEANYLCSDLISIDSLPGLASAQKESVIGLAYEVKKETFKDRSYVFIKLTATITHHYVLAPLQNSLLTYFTQCEPVVRQRKLRGRFYDNMIKKLDDEIAGLEEMKRNDKEKFASMSSNPFTQSAELYERRMNYENELEKSPVYVVKGFGAATTVAATSNPKFPYIILGFLAGTFILGLILFIRFFRVYYKQFEQETN